MTLQPSFGSGCKCPAKKKEVVNHGEKLYESVPEHISCGITDCKQ